MREHWARFGPPVYRSVALYLGLVEDKPNASTEMTESEFEALMQSLAPGGAG